MDLDLQLVHAFAYKGLTLDWMFDNNYDMKKVIVVEGLMYGVNVEIHFADEADAKIWFEKQFDYAVEDAAELYDGE